MGDFLDNLKNAVEEGEFNSDAAKKINQINEKADGIDPKDAEKLIEKRLEDSGTKVVSEDDVVAKNLEYDREMENIQYKDLILQQIATIQEMEYMVSLSVQDMFQYIKTLEEKFSFDEEDKENLNEDLYNEIKRVRAKFSDILP